MSVFADTVRALRQQAAATGQSARRRAPNYRADRPAKYVQTRSARHASPAHKSYIAVFLYLAVASVLRIRISLAASRQGSAQKRKATMSENASGVTGQPFVPDAARLPLMVPVAPGRATLRAD